MGYKDKKLFRTTILKLFLIFFKEGHTTYVYMTFIFKGSST